MIVYSTPDMLPELDSNIDELLEGRLVDQRERGDLLHNDIGDGPVENGDPFVSEGELLAYSDTCFLRFGGLRGSV